MIRDTSYALRTVTIRYKSICNYHSSIVFMMDISITTTDAKSFIVVAHVAPPSTVESKDLQVYEAKFRSGDNGDTKFFTQSRDTLRDGNPSALRMMMWVRYRGAFPFIPSLTEGEDTRVIWRKSRNEQLILLVISK